MAFSKEDYQEGLQCWTLAMSVQECSRCTAHKPDGSRCRINTCKVGPMCWIHTKSKKHLQVKRSTTGHGLGLFAVKASKSDPDTIFKKGDKISDYSGEIVQGDIPKRDTSYMLSVSARYHIDGRKTNSSPGRYANDCHKTNKACNAKLSTNTTKRIAMIKSKKNIPSIMKLMT